MRANAINCFSCDENINISQDNYYDAQWGKHEGQSCCYACYENAQQYTSCLVRIAADGIETVKFDENFIFCGDEYCDTAPSWFFVMVKERTWKRTDPWRGYYQTTLKNGFTRLGYGWLTGYPDSTVGHKLYACDFSNWIRHHHSILPAPLYWLFEPTSNVFSTSSEIIVDKPDYDAIAEVLRSNGWNVESLELAFT
jgi:hypothetical protein